MASVGVAPPIHTPGVILGLGPRTHFSTYPDTRLYVVRFRHHQPSGLAAPLVLATSARMTAAGGAACLIHCALPAQNPSRSIGPEALRHLHCPPQGRNGEGRTVIIWGCGARRPTHHDWTASRQSPVIHARGRAGVRDRRQQTWHGFADVSCPIVAPGSNRRQPALACALGGQIRDDRRIGEKKRAGINSASILRMW